MLELITFQSTVKKLNSCFADHTYCFHKMFLNIKFTNSKTYVGLLVFFSIAKCLLASFQLGMFFCSHFQAQEDLSKQLQVMKSMLYGAESSAAANSAAGQNQDQQSDIVLAQLSQVMTLRLLSRFQEVGLSSKTWLTLH